MTGAKQAEVIGRMAPLKSSMTDTIIARLSDTKMEPVAPGARKGMARGHPKGSVVAPWPEEETVAYVTKATLPKPR